MEQYQIISLGGSGEDSRNCFYVQAGAECFLLDCGVRRELHIGVKRVYPALTREIAQKLTAVFISHAHEDHTAALPYLHELGYRGPVYGTQETLTEVKNFLQKWVDYIKRGGDTIPFQEENINALDFRALTLGEHTFPTFRVRLGRSGHMMGSVWFHFTFGERTLLYTGDFTYDGRLLACDQPPHADTVIMECAYAARQLDQNAQYDHLLALAQKTLAAGGKFLLPVPAKGRGIDLLELLSTSGMPIFAEESVLKSARSLSRAEAWLRRPLDIQWINVRAVNGENRNAVVNVPRGAIYLFPDGMMTSPSALFYYDRFKGEEANRIVITGHTSKGTVGSMIFQPEYRRENQVCIQAEQCTVKVHLDCQDALKLSEHLCPKRVMLFHSDCKDCQALSNLLAQRNIEVFCTPSNSMRCPF